MNNILRYWLFYCLMAFANSYLFAQSQVTLVGKSFYLNGKSWTPLGVNYSVVLVPNGTSFYPTRDPQYTKITYDEGCGNPSGALANIGADFATMQSLGINCIRLVGGFNAYYNSNDGQFEAKMEACPGAWGLSPLLLKGVGGSLPYSGNPSVNPGCAAFFSALKQVIDLAGSYNIKVMLLNGGGNIYVTPGSTEYGTYLTALSSYLATDVNLFAYDLVNEPDDLGNSPTFAPSLTKQGVCELTTEWYNSIKSSAPNSLVTLGDLGSIDIDLWDPGIMDLDFVCFHPYPGVTNNINSGQVSYGINRVLSEIYWYSNNINQPWMIGETGFSAPCTSGCSNGCTTLNGSPAQADGSYTDQENFVTQVLNAINQSGGAGALFWQYGDVEWYPIGSPYESQDHYGVITDECSNLKPATYAIQNFNPANKSVVSDQPQPSNYYNYYGYSYYAPITGTVVDQNNNPIQGAVVYGWYNWNYAVYTFTRADGTFSLHLNDNTPVSNVSPYGQYEIWVSAPATTIGKFYSALPAIPPGNHTYTLTIPSPYINGNIVFSSPYIASGSRGYIAYDDINTTSGVTFTVPSGTNVDLLAGQSITIAPGFDSKSGSSFDAKCEIPSVSCSDAPHQPSKFRQGNGNISGTTVIKDTITTGSILSFHLKEPVQETLTTIYVSPNPTFDGQSTIYISNPDDYSQITVSNTLGQVIRQINNPKYSNTINLLNNARGVYIINVSGTKNTFTTKIIYE